MQWGFLAATAAFLLSTFAAAPAVALVSRLGHGPWGVPLRRVSELCALSNLVTVPLLIVLLGQLPQWQGRPSIWLDWPFAPFTWDTLALLVLLLASFVVALVPLAPALRSWRGAIRQWRVLELACAVGGSLYLMAFVFVHLLVSSDLAISLVPGWASANFPAYHAVTALLGGVAVAVLLLPLVKDVPRSTFHACGRLLLTLSLLWFYFTWSELLTYWYGRTPAEIDLLALLMFGSPALPLFVGSALLCFVLPVALLIWNPIRASPRGVTLVAALVVVGLYLDRLRVYVAAWSVAGPVRERLGTVPTALPSPALVDVAVTLALVLVCVVLVFAAIRRLAPLAPWEQSQLRLLRQSRPYLRTHVTIIARTPFADPLGASGALLARDINIDLLGFTLHTPRWFWLAAAGLLVILGVGVLGELAMILAGLELMGLTNTVYWAVLITNFIFWVGISHAGVMISAILRLTHAEWRRPITRSAEVLAVFALATAAIFPLIHSGRVWRTIYWVFPYDFTRGVWPDVRSALIWDPSAILTYLTGTLLFIYVDLIPDLATARNASSGFPRSIYAALAMGFRGTSRQWRIQAAAGLLLSALILPVFVSVHSIVAWDLSMAILPAWHTTVLAPYFVIGAVHSGVAGVVMVMAALRKLLHLERYIEKRHFETIGRLQIAVAFGYLFFFLLDFYFGLFSRDAVEESIWNLRLFDSPTNLLLIAQVLTTVVIPLPMWFVKGWRSSPAVMFWIATLLNVGMWLERYLLVVTPQSLKQPFVFTWVGTYQPQPVEYLFTLAALAMVAFGLLLFAKVFPIVPLWDVKEGAVFSAPVRIGARVLPAAIKEPHA